MAPFEGGWENLPMYSTVCDNHSNCNDRVHFCPLDKFLVLHSQENKKNPYNRSVWRQRLCVWCLKAVFRPTMALTKCHLLIPFSEWGGRSVKPGSCYAIIQCNCQANACNIFTDNLVLESFCCLLMLFKLDLQDQISPFHPHPDMLFPSVCSHFFGLFVLQLVSSISQVWP